MFLGAENDAVDHRAEDAGNVRNRFALAEADVLLFEEHRAAAEVRHPGFETDAGAERHFFENEAQHFAVEALRTNALLEVGLQFFGDSQNRFQFVDRNVGERKEVTRFHRN